MQCINQYIYIYLAIYIYIWRDSEYASIVAAVHVELCLLFVNMLTNNYACLCVSVYMCIKTTYTYIYKHILVHIYVYIYINIYIYICYMWIGASQGKLCRSELRSKQSSRPTRDFDCMFFCVLGGLRQPAGKPIDILFGFCIRQPSRLILFRLFWILR